MSRKGGFGGLSFIGHARVVRQPGTTHPSPLYTPFTSLGSTQQHQHYAIHLNSICIYNHDCWIQKGHDSIIGNYNTLSPRFRSTKLERDKNTFLDIFFAVLQIK